MRVLALSCHQVNKVAQWLCVFCALIAGEIVRLRFVPYRCLDTTKACKACTIELPNRASWGEVKLPQPIYEVRMRSALVQAQRSKAAFALPDNNQYHLHVQDWPSKMHMILNFQGCTASNLQAAAAHS